MIILTYEELFKEIDKFAEEMKVKIAARNIKYGDTYKTIAIEYLRMKVKERVARITTISKLLAREHPELFMMTPRYKEMLREECVDLANFALMIWRRIDCGY